MSVNLKSGYKDIAQRDSCFRPGSTLCPGCMESVAFQNIGRVTDNGVKTIFSIGTSCAEVSTLAFPNVVAWGRGDQAPEIPKRGNEIRFRCAGRGVRGGRSGRRTAARTTWPA